MVICLEQGVDLHMAQLMPLPLTVFSKIQIGFTFLVPADVGCPGQRAVKRVCVCVCPLRDDGKAFHTGGLASEKLCCQNCCVCFEWYISSQMQTNAEGSQYQQSVQFAVTGAVMRPDSFVDFSAILRLTNKNFSKMTYFVSSGT